MFVGKIDTGGVSRNTWASQDDKRQSMSTMSRRKQCLKTFNLLLLDANVVIELFRKGLRDKLLTFCDVHLARTVV